MKALPLPTRGISGVAVLLCAGLAFVVIYCVCFCLYAAIADMIGAPFVLLLGPPRSFRRESSSKFASSDSLRRIGHYHRLDHRLSVVPGEHRFLMQAGNELGHRAFVEPGRILLRSGRVRYGAASFSAPAAIAWPTSSTICCRRACNLGSDASCSQIQPGVGFLPPFHLPSC